MPATRLGLLVFTEMPGWRYIGDESWKAQALQNCREMVCQCRNHPSIFLWGARVNGSADDEAFYKRTSEAIHGWTPPAPRQARGTTARASCWRMFTPTTITLTVGAVPPAKPAPR